MVMPGCTDGHAHYANTFAMGSMKGGVLFSTQDDKGTVLQKLSEATQKASDAGKRSLCGFGWNSLTLRKNDILTLTELDNATHGVSTVIFDSSGHHAYCNSECLKRCKILSEDGKTVLIKEIDGGLLELDDKGYPTGYVNERVTGYLTRMGGIDADELIDDEVAEDAIRKAQDLLLSTGYTTAMDGWSNQMHPGKFYEVAHRMDTNGTLKLVFPMTYEVEPWQTNMTEQIDYLASLNETYRTRHVLPEYLKVFMDGVVEARTGATIKPYKDGTYYKSFWSVDRLADITGKCNARGLTVHTHVMGDVAIKETVDAYIQGGDGTHRNCLVHLRNVREEDFKRIAETNIACTAGATWHVGDREFDEYLSAVLVEEYVKHAYPIGSFFEAGVKVSCHSDYPANIPSPQDPFGMMQAAVTGMVPDPGEHDYPFDTAELITVAQAFQMLTLNGAWQLGLEDERGSIKVGKWADFVLADQDVFECAATDIGKTKVVSTWFEGEKVYEAGSKEPLAPGQSSEPFDSVELAQAAIKSGAVSFAPTPDVEKVLKDSDVLTVEGYKAMFTSVIYPSENKYRVMYALTENATNALEQSVHTIVTNLNLAALAAASEEGVDMTLTGGIPGFYYTLFKSEDVTLVTDVGSHDKANSDRLCDKTGAVTFEKVTKPSDAAGFFTVRVSPEQVFTGEADLAGAIVVISPILIRRVD